MALRVPREPARRHDRPVLTTAAVTALYPTRPRTAGRAAWGAVTALGFGLLVVLIAAAAALAVGPRFLPYQALPVLTGSMEPAIPVGSLAIDVPVRADDLVVGDVITFRHPLNPSEYVTHRIVAVETDATGRRFVTKGDANAQPDSWRVIGTGDGLRVAVVIPAVGQAIADLARPAVRLAIFALALSIIAGLVLLEIWRPRHRGVRPPIGGQLGPRGVGSR